MALPGWVGRLCVAALVCLAVPTLASQVDTGEQVFNKIWGPDEGLGPHFNTSSCVSCHLNGGRGAPPTEAGAPSDSTTIKLGVLPASETEAGKLLTRVISSFPEPIYGHQLQTHTTDGSAPEGTFTVTYRDRQVQLSDATITLREPVLSVSATGRGAVTPGVLTSPRIANSLFGLGLLEAIPEKDILAKADVEDEDGDGISGKPNMIRDAVSGKILLGRFGWKSGQPTVRQQNAAAFSLDMGLTTSLFLKGGNTPEVSDPVLDALTAFTNTLPVPKGQPSPDAEAGKRLFHEAGCAACHTPTHTTKDGTTIHPYTNLLLHDMGDELADRFLEGDADYWEWRTPPLWGIGRNSDVNGNGFFLHDGRARTLLEAILWHGGEGKKARDAVAAMTARERDQLIAFLNSL
ncbi:MAG: di-heme oxidoredictase family protein [Pseudomonadota bacterium]